MRAIIDGATFQQMVIHGAASINMEKQHINDLNVFPVPDGDTGTNMSLTIASAVTELRKKPHSTVDEVAATTASALLRGARGNSGVILSLLFRGFAKAMKDKATIDGRDFATALDFGVSAAYHAVMKPAEGTILTVSRLAAAQAAIAVLENNNLEFVLESAIIEGQAALAETINQNPVLKKAGVVDAGGKGFLIILQGMLDELRGLPIPEYGEKETAVTREKAEFEAFSTEEITFGYCTEFICSRDNKKDPSLLRDFLDGLGDSLVLVEDDDIIKVHVHTNNPDKALGEALTYGALLKVKIENMREQHTEILEGVATKEEPSRKIAPPEKGFGFVAVCAGDGLASVFRDLGVDGIVGGGQTMNPSTDDLLREIDRTPAKTVFVLPNNKNIIMAAEQCIPLSEEKTVVVLPSKTVPQGIAALLAMDPDAAVDANTSLMIEAIGNVHTSEVTYAARDSDFDGFAIKQGDYLAMSEGQLFATEQDLDALLKKLAQDAPQQNASFLSIFYGADVTEAQANHALSLFQEACPNAETTLLSGGQPVYYYMISAE